MMASVLRPKGTANRPPSRANTRWPLSTDRASKPFSPFARNHARRCRKDLSTRLHGQALCRVPGKPLPCHQPPRATGFGTGPIWVPSWSMARIIRTGDLLVEQRNHQHALSLTKAFPRQGCQPTSTGSVPFLLNSSRYPRVAHESRLRPDSEDLASCRSAHVSTSDGLEGHGLLPPGLFCLLAQIDRR